MSLKNLIFGIIWCLTFAGLGCWLAFSDAFWVRLIGYVLIAFFGTGLLSQIKQLAMTIKGLNKLENDPDEFVQSFLEYHRATETPDDELMLAKARLGIEIYEMEKSKLSTARPHEDESEIGDEAARNVRSKYPELYPGEMK